MGHDIFRPQRDPAQQIYDAFVAESTRRPGRSVEERILAERHAVLNAANAQTPSEMKEGETASAMIREWPRSPQ